MNKGTKKKKIHIKRFYKQNRYGLLSSVMLWCKQISKHCALCLNLFILVTMVRLHWISSVWIHYDLHQNNTVENSVPLTSLHFLLWLKIAAAGANFFAFELIAFSHIIIQTSFEILTCLIFFLSQKTLICICYSMHFYKTLAIRWFRSWYQRNKRWSIWSCISKTFNSCCHFSLNLVWING